MKKKPSVEVEVIEDLDYSLETEFLQEQEEQANEQDESGTR
jgi:hypothetical protein